MIPQMIEHECQEFATESSNTEWVEWLAAIEIVLFSGGIRFYGFLIHYAVYIATAFLLFFLRRPNLSQSSYRVIGTILVFVLINQFVLQTNMISFDFIRIIIYGIGSFFIISSVNFYSFREKLLVFLSLILIPSIIVQILYMMSLIPSYPFEIGDRVFYMSLGIFNVEWGNVDTRMSSIYWEPGQCQLVIVLIMSLFFDELINIKDFFYFIKKYGILFVALLMTNSTMGYLCLGAILMIILMSNMKGQNNKVILLFYLSIALLFSYAIWGSEVVQSKIEQREEVNEMTSYAIRASDNLALFNITMDSPLLGVGMGTEQFENLSEKYDNYTSSNGWLMISATCGIPFLLFYLVNIFSKIKMMDNRVNPFLILSLIVLTQANEWGFFFPILFLYMFRFDNYDKPKEEYLLENDETDNNNN